MQHGTDGDYRRERISEKQELQKKRAAQDPQHGCKTDGDDSQDLDNRSGKLKQPQVRQRKESDSAVARTKQHAAR